MSAVDVVKTGTPHVQYGAWARIGADSTTRMPRPEIFWLGVGVLVEMGESRTPRPNKRNERYATGLSGVLMTYRLPPPAGSSDTCPLALGSA